MMGVGGVEYQFVGFEFVVVVIESRVDMMFLWVDWKLVRQYINIFLGIDFKFLN